MTATHLDYDLAMSVHLHYVWSSPGDFLVGLEMWMQVQRCKLNILEWRGNTLFEDNLIAKQYQVFTKNYAESDFSDEQGVQHSWVGEVTQLQL